MYHNVGDASTGCMAGVPAISAADFELQLDGICARADVVGLGEFLGGNPPGSREKVLLTFDDALSCHYRVVVPILIRRGLSAVFFVPAGPYDDGRVLDVHLIQFLLAKRDAPTEALVRRHLLEAIAPWRVTDEELAKRFPGLLRNRHDLDDVALIKKYLQVFLPPETRRRIVDDAAARFFGPGEVPRVEDVYMTWAEVAKVAKAGFAVGGHSRSHPWMAYVDPGQLNDEIGRSEALVRGLGQRVLTFCYPYGSYSDCVIDAVKHAGFHGAFTTEAANVRDLERQRYSLPRFDTIDLAPFAASKPPEARDVGRE